MKEFMCYPIPQIAMKLENCTKPNKPYANTIIKIIHNAQLRVEKLPMCKFLYALCPRAIQ
jgi:hypothetical protein